MPQSAAKTTIKRSARTVPPRSLDPSPRAGSGAASACSGYAMPSQYHSCRVGLVPLDPSRTVAELRELQRLTGDDDGAQRVAWTETWERAREWLRTKVAGTGADENVDAAGNQWFTLGGASDQAVLIGGHIDSVPNGGWLDGALNVVAGVEVLRRVAEQGEPPV